MRVLVADDETLMRRALVGFLNSAENIVVVGEARDGAEAVALESALKPDVVLMDIRMPKIDGAQATAQILQSNPGARVLAITTFSSERSAVAAIRAGAAGYVFKDEEPSDLIAAVHKIHAGECVLSQYASQDIIRFLRSIPYVSLGEELTSDHRLSDRETSVVELLAKGMSNSEISGHLHLAESTVKTHLGRIMNKWNVRDRTQVLIQAVRIGLVVID